MLKHVGLLLVVALVSCSENKAHTPPLKLGMKSEAQVRELFEDNPNFKESPEAKRLISVTTAGKRAYDWLTVVNSARGKGQTLSYSSPEQTKAPTLEKPHRYNGDSALSAYNEVLSAMPPAYRAVLEGAAPFPKTIPVSETEFLTLGLKVVNAYDTAARWIMMQDYLGFYETQVISDVRGYYFLSRLQDRNQKLQSFSTLPASEQTQLRTWMIGVCLNSQGFASVDPAKCKAEVNLAEKQNELVKFYESHQARSKEIWNLYFELDSYFAREDITWTARDPNTLHYPFVTPANQDIFSYLRDNVEAEWQLGSWKLKLDFTADGSDWSRSRLEYKKDAYAHMERNRIVMDESEPLTEYLSQWTIRHEFGHLLGFKDCYAEFYDVEAKVMVNYALDPSNIMCSRTGKVQAQHIDLLRAQYYR